MIGTQLGSYRLVKLLGSGGMGRVYQAEHVVMGDAWAIKVLDAEMTKRPAIVARFVDEARAAARIRHRNLVRVYQIEQAPAGPWYMVLEYLEGKTLSHFVRSHGPAAPDLTVRIACQIASALWTAHAQKIIHRDIKPANVVLVQRDADPWFPVLLDFGVAHLGDLASGPVTQQGVVIGTPMYMAAEQLLGKPVGPSADLFSLGVLVYELATGGRLPWQHDGEARHDYVRLTATELYRRQTSEAPVDPRRHVPGMSDSFARALLAPLHPDPNLRPADERVYILALAHAAPGDTVIEDGLSIVRTRAPELLETDDVMATVRTAAPAILATAGAEANYVVRHKLGAGGMAEVFLATQVGTAGFERLVVIKRVLPELSAQPSFAARFIVEARIASRLAHPNIATVTDFRKDEQGRLFLVMEYVEGKDLAMLLESGPLSPSITIYVVVEMLRGLGFAHDSYDTVTETRGVVHRDVSPHNILLSYEGEVKVADFGLARARDADGRANSRTISGKPCYMAPEQASGKDIDNRSDLFAAGVILWEMLAHQPLFNGSVSEVMAQVLFKDIERPSTIRRGVRADLEAVAMKLLERDPAKRYPTAEAAIAALLACSEARLDGRDELVRALRERFPRAIDSVAPRASVPLDRGAFDARAVAEHAAMLRAEAPTRTGTPTTLGASAAESVASATTAPPRRLWLIFGAVAALTAGVVATTLLFARKGDDRGAPPAVSPQVSSAVVVATTIADSAPDPAPIDAMPASITADAVVIAIPAPDAPVMSPVPVDAPAAANVLAKQAGPEQKPRVRRAPASPPVLAAPEGPGELAILVKPWATIRLNGKPAGSTPYRFEVPSGRYKIRIENEDLGKTEDVTVIVRPGKPTVVSRKWE